MVNPKFLWFFFPMNRKHSIVVLMWFLLFSQSPPWGLNQMWDWHVTKLWGKHYLVFLFYLIKSLLYGEWVIWCGRSEKLRNMVHKRGTKTCNGRSQWSLLQGDDFSNTSQWPFSMTQLKSPNFQSDVVGWWGGLLDNDPSLVGNFKFDKWSC